MCVVVLIWIFYNCRERTQYYVSGKPRTKLFCCMALCVVITSHGQQPNTEHEKCTRLFFNCKLRFITSDRNNCTKLCPVYSSVQVHLNVNTHLNSAFGTNPSRQICLYAIEQIDPTSDRITEELDYNKIYNNLTVLKTGTPLGLNVTTEF